MVDTGARIQKFRQNQRQASLTNHNSAQRSDSLNPLPSVNGLSYDRKIQSRKTNDRGGDSGAPDERINNSMQYNLQSQQRKKPTTSHMHQPVVSELNSNYNSAKKDQNPSFLIGNSSMHVKEFGRNLSNPAQNILKPVQERNNTQKNESLVNYEDEITNNPPRF